MRPSLRLLPLSLLFGLLTTAQAKDEAFSTSPQARALKHPTDMFALCRGDAIPAFFGVPPLGDSKLRKSSPSDVWADIVDLSKVGTSLFEQNVEIRHADQWILSDRATFQHDQDTWQADGSVKYQDNSVRMTADHADGDTDNDVTHLDMVQKPVQYQMLNARGNGLGAHGTVVGDLESFTDATYSTCDPDNQKWVIHGNKVDLNHKTAIGTAHGATMKIGDVPVMYLPWMTFSLNDDRKSGFLTPSLGASSHSGFMLSLPYYFNLAPNYDETLTGRYYGDRGLMLDSEFRFLTPSSHGTIEASWLPDDYETHTDRGLLDIKAVDGFAAHWYTSADINHVSDPYYLQDFSNDPYGNAIGLLASQVGVYGRGKYWSAGAYVQDWEITDPSILETSVPFRREPDTYFNWLEPFGDHLELGLRSEAVRFEQDVLTGGTREDLYPTVAFPFEHAAWFVRPELGYRYTSYQLDQPVAAGGPTDPSRSLPIFDLDMGSYFERNTTLFGHDFVNTLEPRLFYLNVPYRNQDDIPIFDTQPYTFDFEQLFRTNAYTGADRQSNANQVTLAVTSRLLDAADGKEWLTGSLGEIRYFDPQLVQLPGTPAFDISGSDYVADADVALDDRWSVGAEYQYNPETSQTDVESMRAQYKFPLGGVINAAYRYRRGLIRETDFSVIYPLNENWRLLGRWDYSQLEKSTLEGLAGLEWQDCCMATRVLVRDYFRDTSGDREVALFVELELKGLGSLGKNTAELLDRDILGYNR